MPKIFKKETVIDSGITQDHGKLAEIDNHELLKDDNKPDQIASFDQIRSVGKWYLGLEYNNVLPSSKPLPQNLLLNHTLNGGGVFLAKLALGAGAENQFPVTIEPVQTAQGIDLRVHIVPIHFGALEVAQFAHHTDSLLALAAAAATAPQFILALEGGIETTICNSKKGTVTSITPDHGTPLAVTFDTFDLSSQTLDTAVSITGNNDLSIKQAAHLHGQTKIDTKQVSRAASASKIAAGVPIRTFMRNKLPKHALFISTKNDDISGQTKIVGMNESLLSFGIQSGELSYLAAALGFTARVVGDDKREQTIETILQPDNANLPLKRIIS